MQVLSAGGSNMGRMDFDAILNHIGQCGKWQWRNFFLLWLTRDGYVNTIHIYVVHYVYYCVYKVTDTSGC